MYSYPDFGTEFSQQFKVTSNFFKDEFDREAEYIYYFGYNYEPQNKDYEVA